MNFKLSPSSGSSDSYYDIRFQIEFQECDKAIITILNEISKSNINILGISSGYILNGNQIVIHNTSAVEGYINLFNNDKMNKQLFFYSKVDLTCNIELYKNNKVYNLSTTISFYNESMSMDYGIAPFELILENPKVNIIEHKPMVVYFISSSNNSYELCIQPKDRKIQSYFHIRSKPGKMKISIPAEILFYDLNLGINYNKPFDIYWVKPEGVTYHRIRNKKYILIPNTHIDFTLSPKILIPNPQSRQDPTGTNLSDNFILSNRYFVPTLKKRSGFAKYVDMHISNLSKLLHESHDINNQKKSIIEKFDTNKPSYRETERIRTNDIISKKYKRINNTFDNSQKSFLRSFSSVYHEKTSNIKTIKNSNIKQHSTQSQLNNKPQGCGCSKNK